VDKYTHFEVNLYFNSSWK